MEPRRGQSAAQSLGPAGPAVNHEQTESFCVPWGVGA